MAVKTQGLTHIHLKVRDLKRSVRFYVGVFGMRERFRVENMAFLRPEGTLDTITLAEDASTPAGPAGSTTSASA